MKRETKDTIIMVLFGISFISFIVMVWGMFIHLSIWGLIAMPISITSFMIAFIMAFPFDKSKTDGGRDLG